MTPAGMHGTTGRRAMAKTRGTGLLMLWADIDLEYQAEYHRWNPWSNRIRPLMRHDVGSPGAYRRLDPK
jgi:hypothetical protein